jgi:outer membrane protein OmpA-like peptidoglycan-associated protein
VNFNFVVFGKRRYRLALLASAVLLTACKTAPVPKPAERSNDTNYWFQSVPRKPDVAAYPALREHVFAIPAENREYIVVRILFYPKQRVMPTPTFAPVAQPARTLVSSQPMITEKAPKMWEAKVHFPFDVATMDKLSRKQIDDLLASVGENIDGASVVVEAHTDSIGTESYNDKLSARRASVVTDYLVRKGVDKGAVKTLARGDHKPVGPNDTQDGRAANRRAEIHIQKKD